MASLINKVRLKEFDRLHADAQPWHFYGCITRHFEEGDIRLKELQFDPSAASHELWNLLLTEEQRLHHSRKQGKLIVGVMKDLGTMAALAYCFDGVVAFYPDGAWWIPCIMQQTDKLFEIADRHGFDESFCPVRAMLGAFESGKHFPVPEHLICSTGTVCDDFSAVSQQLEHMGHEIIWWEMPYRYKAGEDDDEIELPGIFTGTKKQIEILEKQFNEMKYRLEIITGQKISNDELAQGIKKNNSIRRLINRIRNNVYGNEFCVMPSLEMLIVEMMAVHFCSDMDLCRSILNNIDIEVNKRIKNQNHILEPDASKVFWVNPPADLRIMNIMEDAGLRLCGTEFLFSHAIDPIREDVPPLQALAMSALADPMTGSSFDRAERILQDAMHFGAEGVIINRIPGASHCAAEGMIIKDYLKEESDLSVLEIEVPGVCDSVQASLKTRLDAFSELLKHKRQK